jgi:hypothetical protein
MGSRLMMNVLDLFDRNIVESEMKRNRGVGQRRQGDSIDLRRWRKRRKKTIESIGGDSRRWKGKKAFLRRAR